MLKDLKITLYDIFGYLLPGVVFFLGVAILFWTVLFPHTPLIINKLTTEIWILCLFLAYFSGHMAQALGNLLDGFLPSNEKLALAKKRQDNLPVEIIQEAKLKVGALLNCDLKNISAQWLYNICDEAVVQFGCTEDREIYQYREGFYRGLIVSLFVFSLSLILRTVVPVASVKLSDVSQVITWPVLLFFIIISFTGVYFFYIRYRRFAKYRITRTIIAFLVLQRERPLKTMKKRC